MCLQACRWCSNTLHTAYCPPRSMCGFQSSRSRVIQTIQSQSPPCFSYPFLSFLCQCTISVLASLRMCYEMISYLTQRTRHHKKNPPTLLLCNSSSVSEVFKNDFFCFFCQSEREESISFCQRGARVYMYAHVWRCNQPSVFVDKCPEGEIIIDGVETFSNSSLMK